MKRWPGILIALSLLAALLWGCGGSHDARVTAVLDRADSLLRTSDTAAHSAALRQMLALDTARALHADKALRARHALLLVQARYKCYVTEPADSALIDTAYRYYADHHGSEADQERYTRTLIYQGAVAEELGHPQQALQWYLEAEQAADPNDHFNLGHAKFLIANIYHANYSSVPVVINKYKEALKHYLKTNEIRFQIVCYREIGALYRTSIPDSALLYLNKAISLASKLDDTNYLFSSQMMLARLFYEQGNYQKSKNLAVNIINNSKSDFRETQQFYIAADSYIKLGMLDSAQFVINNTPNPERAEDSMRMSRTLSELHKSRKNYKAYSNELLIGNQIADSILIHASEVNLPNKERAFKSRKQYSETVASHSRRIVILASLITALLIIILVYRKKHRQARHKMSLMAKQLQEAINKLNEASQLQQAIDLSKEESMSKLIASTESQIHITQSIFEKLASHKRVKDFEPINHLASILSINSDDDSFWNSLKLYLDAKYNNIITYLQDTYPAINTPCIRFICLCFAGFSNTAIAYCTNVTSTHTITNKKRTIPVEFMGLDMNLNEVKKRYMNGEL